LTPLSELPDFEIGDNSPDVRGWPVQSADGRRVGTVDDLLVDTDQLKARYLVVHLDGEVRQTATDQQSRLLFPVASAQVDEDDRRIDVSLASAHVQTLPAYSREIGVPEGYGDRFGRSADAPTAPRPRTSEPGRDDLKRMTRSAEELRFRKRERPAGEVHVKKHVETEHVSQPVRREREDVTIERRPASARAGRPEIREDEVRVPITEEEIVVEKRPVVKEELVIGKHKVEEATNVEADLRKERVDVERTRGAEDIDPDPATGDVPRSRTGDDIRGRNRG